MKILKRALCIVGLLMFSVCLTACDDSAITCKNGHRLDGEWHTDDTSHYIVCLDCGDVVSKKHNFDWKVTQEATKTTSEIKTEYCVDCGYCSGRKDSLDTWNGKTITTSESFANKIKKQSYTDSQGRSYNQVEIYTAADLARAFAELDDHQNLTIKLTGDIDINDGVWTSAYINGYDCGDVEIIIDGNYHKIIGLTNPLIGRISSGNVKVVIQNLILEEANIDSSGNVGALVGEAIGASSVVVEGCEIIDSSIKGGEYVGGFIGTAGGNSGVYSKIFEEVKISNCAITKSSIGGQFVGGIIGKATSDAWTKTAIKDCAIIDNRITSISENDSNAGIVVGTAGVAGTSKTVKGTTFTGGTYLNNIVESDNSVLSFKTYIHRLYGCQGENTAQLYIDSVKQF